MVPATTVRMNKPTWWNEKHDGTWQRVKGALKRDWEQTKEDFTRRSKREDLNQDVGDTVRQAMGKEPIPPDHVPNPDWDKVEPDYQYGVGARMQYGDEHKAWDDRLESKLRDEWKSIDDRGAWDDVKGRVRRGYEYNDRKK